MKRLWNRLGTLIMFKAYGYNARLFSAHKKKIDSTIFFIDFSLRMDRSWRMNVSKSAKFLQRLLETFLKRFNIVCMRHVRDARIADFFVSSLGYLTMRKMVGGGGVKVPTASANKITGYGLYGLIFGGPVPHFFYEAWDTTFLGNDPATAVWKCAVERLLFTPLYQYVSLYSLSRLEENTHRGALLETNAIYWKILAANLLIVTVAQFVDLQFMRPPCRLRTVFRIGVDFCWTMYVTKVKIAAAKHHLN